MADIVTMDATALAAAIRARKVSCVEAMAAYLDQIDRLNPQFNAIVALRDRASLLREAAERDDEIGRGECCGALHGLPMAIKDLEPVAGIASTSGSPILRDHVPAADSLMVSRLRAAGAVFVGKTNVPEFGLGSQSYNPVYGVTRNAYDPTRTAGGSSGGAAVALALRMLPLADGSDYGGSLRNPAAWNNVFGLRTSYGRVPSEAADAFLPSMGVLGPMARSVPDLGLLLSVQAGHDACMPFSLRDDPARFAGALDAGCAGMRIGWLGDLGGALPMEAGVLDLCEAALHAFEDLGCNVEPMLPTHFPEQLWQDFITLRHWQVATNLGPHYRDPAQRALLKPEAVWEVEGGLKLTAQHVSAASAGRTAWHHALRKLFERCDVCVLPAAQVFAFPADLHWPADIAGRTMDSYHRWMQVMAPATMGFCPVLAVPAGFDPRGLAMGLQLIAPHGAELALLQLGHAYDQATRWVERRPPPAL